MVATPIESYLDAQGRAQWRAELRELAPYLLARLRAERSEERQASQDERRLRNFLAAVEPVGELEVRYELDGREVAASAPRDYFVAVDEGAQVRAFVRWGEDSWPPNRREAESLALALADLFQVGMYESFFTLVTATSSASRRKALELAGAPDLDDARERLEQVDAPEAPVRPPDVLPPEDAEEQEEDAERPAEGGWETDGLEPRIPLYRAEDLIIEGIPITVPGEDLGGGTEHQGRGGEKNGRGGGWRRGLTDLVELDRLGMTVAMLFEQNRLRPAIPQARIFDADDPSNDDFVFNVSTTKSVRLAIERSARFRDAMSYLAELGVNPDFPGFDILTLDSQPTPVPERLIELKSSGVNAVIQTMTWNEWKTARDSALRETYYLYLVGNLRSDLVGAAPFVRAVCDPFGSLLSVEQRDVTIRRSVQINVRNFAAAAHLDLTVRDPGGT